MGVAGTGPVSDLPTCGNTAPVTGNPWVSVTHPHTLFCLCHVHLCTVHSKSSLTSSLILALTLTIPLMLPPLPHATAIATSHMHGHSKSFLSSFWLSHPHHPPHVATLTPPYAITFATCHCHYHLSCAWPQPSPSPSPLCHPPCCTPLQSLPLMCTALALTLTVPLMLWPSPLCHLAHTPSHSPSHHLGHVPLPLCCLSHVWGKTHYYYR